MAKKAATPKPAEVKPEPKPEAKAAPKKAAEPAAKKSEPKPVAKAKAATKSEVFSRIAEKSSLDKKTVAAVFEAMTQVIFEDLDKKGPGIFQIPNLLKLKVAKKPATKERQGVNPATGQPTIIKAKPAHNVIKAVLLKSLKDLAS